MLQRLTPDTLGFDDDKFRVSKLLTAQPCLVRRLSARRLSVRRLSASRLWVLPIGLVMSLGSTGVNASGQPDRATSLEAKSGSPYLSISEVSKPSIVKAAAISNPPLLTATNDAQPHSPATTPSTLNPTPSYSPASFNSRYKAEPVVDNDRVVVPDIGQQGVSFAEQHQNRLIGEWSLQRLYGQVNTLEDPWVQSVIDEMTWQINAQARRQAPLAVVIINDPSINAFAIPGGVIGLNTGTIISADSMDEVASVLAHEVAHLSQRHYEHSDEAKRKALLLQVGGLLAAIAASSASGDAAAAIMMGSQTAALDSQMAFSRDNEREADRVGMQIMSKSGYDARAMPRFFATLNTSSQMNQSSNSFLPSFVRSHPLSAERLSEAQSRAQQYPLMPLSQQTRHKAMFDLLYWRVQMLTGQASELSLKTGAKSSLGATLALASWYARQQNVAAGQQLLQSITARPMAEQQALQPLLAITQSEMASAQGDWSTAANILQAQQRVYPERRDLRLYLAKALTRQGDAAAAQLLLKPLTEQRGSDIAAWQGLQQANDYLAKHTKDSKLASIATINALRYRSHSELWQGQYDQALTSLTQAQTLAKAQASSSLTSTINQEIKNLKTSRDFKP
ncbi:MAG: M48 family metalloprotease [Psychrobacter sp.]|nr:M48 family metalloprotease [Psychrobacter sp.]